MSLPISLNEERLAEAVAYLSGRDPHLAILFKKWGAPPMWPREPGFHTLVYLILEQQVSLASAKATYDRLLARVGGPLVPERFLKLHARTLKKIGFSRQKALYCRLLADSVHKGTLNLESIHAMDDEAARATLTSVKGIGPWTADVYLLMVLQRPDVWPVGDLALQKAARHVKQLRKHPSATKLEKIGEAWRPWRAVAARMLWHDYLSRAAEARNTGKRVKPKAARKSSKANRKKK
ncbi:MAG: DNA-3-methyladenine glycosylase 2 family protein [Acidipila sp.]|nr:DNA-3-methyladenine glycosylase 2 family protein [Acidipila sp.]